MICQKEIFVTQNLPIASLCWSGCVVLAWWGDPLIALTSRAQRREKEGGWGGDFATIGDKTPDSDQFLSWSVANTSAGTNTSEATFKMIFVRKRYLSSIPWVRCASGNVCWELFKDDTKTFQTGSFFLKENWEIFCKKNWKLSANLSATSAKDVGRRVKVKQKVFVNLHNFS